MYSLIAKYKTFSLLSKGILVAALGTSSLGVSAVATNSTTTLKESVTIPYSTQIIEDDTMLSGTQVVSVQGEDGVRDQVISLTKTDGIVRSRKIISDKVVTPATDEVVKKGILDKTIAYDDPEQIPYETEVIDDPDMLNGTDLVTQRGEDGQHVKSYEVLSVKGSIRSRTLLEDKITKPAVPNITHHGINYRVGAICGDNIRSYATGSGACSHHHSVQVWLYEYCSKLYQC